MGDGRWLLAVDAKPRTGKVTLSSAEGKKAAALRSGHAKLYANPLHATRYTVKVGSVSKSVTLLPGKFATALSVASSAKTPVAAGSAVILSVKAVAHGKPRTGTVLLVGGGTHPIVKTLHLNKKGVASIRLNPAETTSYLLTIGSKPSGKSARGFAAATKRITVNVISTGGSTPTGPTGDSTPSPAPQKPAFTKTVFAGVRRVWRRLRSGSTRTAPVCRPKESRRPLVSTS